MRNILFLIYFMAHSSAGIPCTQFNGKCRIWVVGMNWNVIVFPANFYEIRKWTIFNISSFYFQLHPPHFFVVVCSTAFRPRITSKLKTVGAVIYCCATTKHIYFRREEKTFEGIVSFYSKLFLWFCGMT